MKTCENPLTAVKPDEVIQSYDSLDLEDWSDFELFRAAAEIVSEPKLKFSSFALHAPLELLFRFSLLPLVAPEGRRLARIQIVAATAVYHSIGPVVDNPPAEALEIDSSPEIVSHLREAIRDGNVERSDQLFVTMAERLEPLTVVDSVAQLSLQTLTGAAHTHIGLMLLARMSKEVVPEILKLPRAGVRYMAKAPDVNLMPTTGPSRLDTLEKTLAEVPKLANSPTSVRGMVQATEEAGLIDEILGDALSGDAGEIDWEEITRTACRIAALSMLTDSPDVAKYGWTHCLTLPQAAWSLARIPTNRALQLQAAQSAVSWVISFRAALGNGHLDTQPDIKPVEMDIAEALRHSPEFAAAVAWHAQPEEHERLIQVIATEAATRTDAHLIKYTWACFDLALIDSQQARLYYAAAAHLCSLWCKEEPSEIIVEQLAVRPGL